VIEPYYTVQQLAELVGVHPETIRREAARGNLRFIRIGRELRFSESAVRDWLASKEVAA
jgi:excisionase family DNA binding protein